ncbi:uncharacterized protein VTP21DRAFT_2131 [Calcarisporiella thermophila]|uniref:uncharacterized protein n=1 Tax=Calcarisporiella thermophila TaxID=911321 RepID=UPI003742AC2F
MESLINKRNKVVDLQRHYQAPSKTPTYLRGPRDRFWIGVYSLILIPGFVGGVYGIYRLSVVSAAIIVCRLRMVIITDGIQL